MQQPVLTRPLGHTADRLQSLRASKGDDSQPQTAPALRAVTQKAAGKEETRQTTQPSLLPFGLRKLAFPDLVCFETESGCIAFVSLKLSIFSGFVF